MFLLILLVIAVSLFLWIFRYYAVSLYIYLQARFERKKIDFQLLSSLRDDLVHERKKKMAGLEMILSSWERGDEIQPKYEYFEELLGQLKNLVQEERRNLMAVTKDIFLWGKLWTMVRRIERVSKQKRERVKIGELRNELGRIQNLIDKVVEGATEKFSFTLNQVVSESVKIVQIEKSQLKDIKIQQQLDDVGDTIRFSYDKFKDWQRLLTNLIRNAIEAVEAKHSSGAGVAADFPPKADPALRDSLRGGREENLWVKISTKQPHSVSVSPSVSVCIEDSGIGMDETTRTSFYKRGFTSGKDGGLGLGVSEESVQLINQYGNWQVESQKGGGTKITINIDREKAQKGELILPPPKPFYRTKLAYGLFVLLLGLIGISLLFTFNKYSRFWVDWNPAYAEVRQGRQIFVYNLKGQQLWMHEFEQGISIRDFAGENKVLLIQVEDLNEDGWNETLVAIGPGRQVSSQLFCFDHKGKTKWVFSAGQGLKDKTVVQTKNSKPDIYEIRDFLVDDFVDTPKKEILVTSQLVAFFPCQLALLDYQGNVIGEYWHPGYIPFSIYADLDEDGEKELVCSGINNRLDWRPVIFVIDLKKLVGQLQGPPDTIFGDLKPAKEKKYVVLPHIKDVAWKWVEASTANIPFTLGIRPDRIFLMLPDGRHYYLTHDLEYEGCEHRIAAFLAWKRLLDFPFELNLEKDSLNWKNFEVYENGVKVK